MNKQVTNASVKWGLIGGLILAVFSLLSYVFYNALFSSFTMQLLYGFLALAVSIFIPVWGVVSLKKEVGGLTFANAFLAGLIIVIVTMTINTAIGYIIPQIDPEYPEQLYEKVKNTTSDSMEKFGVSDEEIDKAMEKIKLEDFKPSAAKTLKSYAIGIGLGALLSLLIAAFVSRPDKTHIQAE